MSVLGMFMRNKGLHDWLVDYSEWLKMWECSFVVHEYCIDQNNKISPTIDKKKKKKKKNN